MGQPGKILMRIKNMYTKKKQKRKSKLERRVVAAELPLRTRAANLGGIVARNDKLAALRASALRADLSRANQMLEDTPFTKNRQVVNAAEQLRKDLARIVAMGR